VVSLLLGVLIRNERVSAISIAGAGICLLGAWLIRPVEPAPTLTARSL
jgi:hypothetical protein